MIYLIIMFINFHLGKLHLFWSLVYDDKCLGRCLASRHSAKMWHEILLKPFSIIAAYDTAAAAESLQSCLTLCDPIDGSPPAPPSLGFSRQEQWSGLPFPSPMHESEKWKWSHSVMPMILAQIFFSRYVRDIIVFFSRILCFMSHKVVFYII